MNRQPDGWDELKAEPWSLHRKGDQLVVVGMPDHGADESDHNCDEMGCGSAAGHVLMRATITSPRDGQ